MRSKDVPMAERAIPSDRQIIGDFRIPPARFAVQRAPQRIGVDFNSYN
jgi:hypothetical protein